MGGTAQVTYNSVGRMETNTKFIVQLKAMEFPGATLVTHAKHSSRANSHTITNDTFTCGEGTAQ